MPTVELVYDGDCPNVAGARVQLLRAFAKADMPPRWLEWRGDGQESPDHVRGYGSPTILVDGKDVAGGQRGGVSCCRLYAQEDGSMRGVPSVEMLTSAISANAEPKERAQTSNTRTGWKVNLAVLPGIGAALLPKVACPACWPAYAGFLGSIGLGFVLDTTYLLPLSALFLAIAVSALAFRASHRRGYGPFALGMAASSLVLVGKFHFESDPAMYAGLVGLIAASFWNGWPQKHATTTCSSCVRGDATIQTNP